MEVVLKTIYTRNEQHITRTVLSLVQSNGLADTNDELEMMQFRINNLEELVALLIEQLPQPTSFIKTAGLVPYDTELVSIK